MVEAIFFQNTNSHPENTANPMAASTASNWQQIATLKVHNGLAPETTGDVSWIDFTMSLESSKLQKEITWAENAEEWLVALAEAYNQTEDVRVEIKAARAKDSLQNSLPLPAKDSYSRSAHSHPANRDNLYSSHAGNQTNSPNANSQIQQSSKKSSPSEALFKGPAQAAAGFAVFLIAMNIIVLGGFVLWSGAKHQDLFGHDGTRAVSHYPTIAVVLMIISGVLFAGLVLWDQWKKHKPTSGGPFSALRISSLIVSALLMGLVAVGSKILVTQFAAPMASEMRIKANIKKAHQAAITRFNIPEMGYPYDYDLQPTYDKLKANPPYKVIGVNPQDENAYPFSEASIDTEIDVIEEEGGRNILYIHFTPLGCRLVTAFSYDAAPLEVRSRKVDARECNADKDNTLTTIESDFQ